MSESTSDHPWRGGRRTMPWGFHPTELLAPGDPFLADIRTELLQLVSRASGEDVDGMAYLDSDEVFAFVAGVASWYSMHYGRPQPDGQQYALEVEGIAGLIAPHVIELPNSIQQRTRGHVRSVHVPYPSAAHVLGFEL